MLWRQLTAHRRGCRSRGMDVEEDPVALLVGDAMHEDSRLAALVKLVVDDGVTLGSAHDFSS